MCKPAAGATQFRVCFIHEENRKKNPDYLYFFLENNANIYFQPILWIYHNTNLSLESFSKSRSRNEGVLDNEILWYPCLVLIFLVFFLKISSSNYFKCRNITIESISFLIIFEYIVKCMKVFLLCKRKTRFIYLVSRKNRILYQMAGHTQMIADYNPQFLTTEILDTHHHLDILLDMSQLKHRWTILLQKFHHNKHLHMSFPKSLNSIDKISLEFASEKPRRQIFFKILQFFWI